MSAAISTGLNAARGVALLHQGAYPAFVALLASDAHPSPNYAPNLRLTTLVRSPRTSPTARAVGSTA